MITGSGLLMVAALLCGAPDDDDNVHHPRPGIGTAARAWSNIYTFETCQTSPNYDAIPDRRGQFNLQESASVSYTCDQSTAGLNLESLGIAENKSMLVNGACWNTNGDIWPAVTAGSVFMLRAVYLPLAEQAAENYFAQAAVSGGTFLGTVDYRLNDLGQANFRMNGDGFEFASLTHTDSHSLGNWTSQDFHYDGRTTPPTITICRDTTCLSLSIADIPTEISARTFALFSTRNCTTLSLTDTVMAGVWFARGVDSYAGHWTQTMHAQDCTSDGTC